MSEISDTALNPKTPNKYIYVINEVFWLLLFLSVPKVLIAGMVLFASIKISIDTIGETANAGAISLLTLSGFVTFVTIVVIVAIIELKRRRSFIAALVLVVIGFLQLYNVLDAYYFSLIAPTKLLLKFVPTAAFIVVSLWALLATYRLQKSQ